MVVKIKTADAEGIVLNWLAAIARYPELRGSTNPTYTAKYLCRFSTDWSTGGPIIDQEDITTARGNDLIFPQGNEHGEYSESLYLAKYPDQVYWMHGRTRLEAAMRCFVARHLGDEVEIPKELICV